MNGVIDCNASDPSIRRKCWEIMVKPSAMKLKNTAISFWCFLAVLISHADMMGWSDILKFTVDSVAVNLLATFVKVPLEMIINRMTTRNRTAAIMPPATRAATAASTAATSTTDGDASVGTVGPTPSQIASFKARGMHNYVLNACDEDLQLWIGNNISKIQSDGPVLFKMLSTKIIQCTRASIRLALTSLHTMTLKDHNNNVEKLANKMEGKIKLLS